MHPLVLLSHQSITAEGIATVSFLPLRLGGSLIELAILFLILALVAGFLGAKGIAGLGWDIAKWLVIIFVVLAILSIVL